MARSYRTEVVYTTPSHVLSSDERNLIDDVYRAFDWDTYPDQIAAALDNIEAARAAS
jgi:hypothetical protein